ncbi:hypothetical protein GGS21DRAFT_517940 [Xylaria nigripes]|nr:hypothetical protein GGS21DRAFT_517940 [Xylaria nigripes]
MLAGLSTLCSQSVAFSAPTEDVPPPTPLNLPLCNPQLSSLSGSSGKRTHPSLVRFLQTIYRPTEMNESHFAALGIHVHVDAPSEDIIPETSYLPSASGWDGIDLDEAKRRDPAFQKPLSNGRISPEARVFLERRAELSVGNQAAFRVVRRMGPEPGARLVRLGSCYEFFRQLEFMASYWDDTSLPPWQGSSDEDEESQSADMPPRTTYRTSSGVQMPAEFRHAAVAAFVKLVSYDFGCNVTPPRVEPRIHLIAPPVAETLRENNPVGRRASYFSSGCVFLYRAPTTREAARAGFVDGPIAAISARNTSHFATPTESTIDFGREVLAALATAQLRDRQGKVEKRAGEGQWWATEKRWGGGEGGPIGREVEGDTIVGDKDAVNTDSLGEDGPHSRDAQSSADKPTSRDIPVRGAPANKKMRRTLNIYDRYRMVRLPSSNWDKKVRYEAIGKVKGADYDDVFVVSSLFHHLSILRVRVPDRLLQVLDGAPEDEDEEGLSWGKLEIWRSKWFDLFLTQDRLEAMRLMWGMMAWSMRKTDGVDEPMGDA